VYAFTGLDWLALAGWLLIWLGYSFQAERVGDRRPNLMAAVALYRHRWMREAYARDPRITDVGLIGNLMQSATFFSSTTLLVLGGSIALIGTVERGGEIVEVMRNLPFAVRLSQELVESKLLVLTFVFVYAFFRFSWSLRQFNLVNIMVGAFPAHPARQVPGDQMVDTAGRLNELAGRNFTQGLRAYYYAVPVLVWLMNAWLFIGATVVISLILYYMEFESATVKALAADRDPQA
jgi:uncharacterized membrane protein